MSRIEIRGIRYFEDYADRMASAEKELDKAADEIQSVRSRLEYSMLTKSYASICRALDNTRQSVENCRVKTGGLRTGAAQVRAAYIRSEQQIYEAIKGNSLNAVEVSTLENIISETGGTSASGITDSISNIFLEEFLSEYGWDDILEGSGYIGTIYGFIKDIMEGKDWKDFLKTGVDIFQFLEGAEKTFKNYMKIGNAVGTKTAVVNWLKNITGLKPLGRASAAQNVFTRFANNLTNKTSPFNAQFRNVISNFTGKNGVGKAVASWGAVIVNGVLNWSSNKQEQAESGGTMSEGRVWAETITETAVDTVLNYGAGIVVGAAVTAVLGTAAAPGVVVVALSGGVIAGLNAGVKALTGKTTTEWISDTLLDTGEAIIKDVSAAGEAVGKAVSAAGNAVGNWFSRLTGQLSFA